MCSIWQRRAEVPGSELNRHRYWMLRGHRPDWLKLFGLFRCRAGMMVSMAVLLGLMTTVSSPAADTAIDFRRDVAPILQQRCVACHNQRDRRGGFSLESAAAARLGGESGQVIVAGEPDTSYLLDLVTPSDGVAEMPRGEPPLEPMEVATLRRWIADGAIWPAGVELQRPILWSLEPLERPEVPTALPNPEAFPIRNPIDAFIAEKHAEARLEPAPQADRRTLIRRLYLDITGLPPAAAAVEAFVADTGADAYERLVNELLESPHYGERWGRYWLDLARYADSEGYLGDALRPHAWVYREWVIEAINRDLPFDQFSIEQLAGDLLEGATLDQRIATGFHRNTLRNTEAGVDLELYRTKEIVDRVSTTGMVWLGLTLGCAECHDHKNDPISQTEFYRFYAFFNNADEVGVPVTRSWEVEEYEAALQNWQPKWTALVADLKPFEVDELTAGQQATIAEAFVADSRSFDWKKLLDLYQTNAPGWKELQARVDVLWSKKPSPPATRARAFARRLKDRRDTFVHIRGVYTRQGDQVQPGTPSVLPALDVRSEEADRLDLAVWLFDERNPLTARVAVNRIWQHLFGEGIVSTPNDFGNKGARPTHPELLDWLATEYRRLGWSRKALIRLIVTSSVYRLSSHANAVPAQQDASNQLLWRQNSYRVSAEIVRDLHLAASGLLDRTIGRRGIRPPLPAFVTEVGRSVKWPVSEGSERYRRGMYIFFKRTVPYPMLMTFDAPDSTISCSRRERSNTPLQALTLLNDPVFHECAQALGQHLIDQHGDDTVTATDDLFLRCLGRLPTDRERASLLLGYADVLKLEREAVGGEVSLKHAQIASMTAIARVVMNLDEFITRD
jgi:hypothetical protein